MVLAGYGRDAALAAAGLDDADPDVRAAALGALARTDALTSDLVVRAMADPWAPVRRRACELAPANVAPSGTGNEEAVAALIERLDDGDTVVIEAASWALGELSAEVAVAALAEVATGHSDPRCREAAIGALGAIGSDTAKGAVLAGLEDRPPVRRRAAVALAAFAGEDVEQALRRCLTDRDWQVRQIAEDLLGA